MSKRTIVYEVKLQPVVIVLLGVIALGVVGNIITKFPPIRDAHASDLQRVQICDVNGHCAGTNMGHLMVERRWKN